MATEAELNTLITEIDNAIKRVVTTGQVVTLDILGFRQTISLANLKELRETKKEYQTELRRIKGRGAKVFG